MWTARRNWWTKIGLWAGIPAVLLSPAAGRAQEASRFSNSSTKKPAKADAKKEPDTYVLIGAGDIASCANLSGAEATARLLDQNSGTIFAAGDLAYERGSYEEFQKCYQPTWGRFRTRTKPAPGNHEYNGSQAVGYFRYWGTQAGDPQKGYYSYELGSWHIVVLNTNCGIKELGGCAEGSPEEVWLKQDLSEHRNSCIVAYGHHILFSSGIIPSHARRTELRAFWRDLYAAHADVIMGGHEHYYERFAPQDPDGNSDPKLGIREFVVGTGGRSHSPLGFASPNSEVRNDDTFGVLKLTLGRGKYSWQFLPISERTFRDSGTGTCHNQEDASK